MQILIGFKDLILIFGSAPVAPLSQMAEGAGGPIRGPWEMVMLIIINGWCLRSKIIASSRTS
jgi:hypothetical protein